MNLSGCPPRFKGRTKLFREEVLAADSMAAEVAARVESAYGYQWRRENDGARRREVHGPFRGDTGLLPQGLRSPGQGTADHRGNLRLYVREGGDARRPPHRRRHPRAVRLRLHHIGTR